MVVYKSLVIEEYQRKLAQNALSQRLVHPSPANLREECIAICKERYNENDEPLLRLCFERQEGRAAYIKAIEMHDINKFKPLINLLKGRIKRPDEKTVMLLAWLIDFADRPYDRNKIYGAKPTQGKVNRNTAETSQHTGTDEPYAQPDNPAAEPPVHGTNSGRPPYVQFGTPGRSFKKLRIATSAIILFTSISLGGYWLGNRNGLQFASIGKDSCMYWAGDHYQQIPCGQEMEGVQVIPLNAEKLAHFKKITNTDTITSKSKGWVWYSKIDNVVEFFTSEGNHPIQRERRLRPVTDYIIYKYVRRKQADL